LTNDERFEANLKLRYWGGGLQLESTFWPVKPLDKRTWRGYILIRIRIDREGKFPEDVNDLEVLASLNDGQRPFSMNLGKADVDELRTRGSKLAIFEATISAGSRSGLAVVTSPDLTVGATSRTAFKVPKPPKTGESASWSLVGGEGSVAGTAILLPATDTTLQAGTTPVFMGYGCGTPAVPGNIVTSVTGDTVAAVPLSFRSPTAGGCGWLMGSPASTLPPGRYVFQPPNVRDGEAVQFEVGER
jgi:hypothetical protein